MKAGGNINKAIYTDITSNTLTIGGKTETATSTPGTQTGGSIIKLDSTNSVIIPFGKTSQRTNNKGGIRYNSETLVFEGCDGTNWSSLGGVSDVDKDTFISAQNSAASDNDELKFYTGGGTPGVPKMVLDPIGNLGIGFQNLIYKRNLLIYNPTEKLSSH